MSTRNMSVARARELAESVPDPELPPLTIGELGIIRSVELVDAVLVVSVTPTYSGCPAVEFIEDRIRAVLEAEGFGPVRIERVFSPTWSSQWMTASGRAKLKEAGIAPPRPEIAGPPGSVLVELGRRAPVPCPRCESTDTSRISTFGSTACKALHRCNTCLEPFDHFKEL